MKEQITKKQVDKLFSMFRSTGVFFTEREKEILKNYNKNKLKLKAKKEVEDGN